MASTSMDGAEAVFSLMQGGPVTYFSKGAKLWGGTVRTPQALVRAMERLSGQDFYINFNFCPRVRFRARRQDVVEWRHVLVDLDPDGSDLFYEGVGDLGVSAWAQLLSPDATACFTGRGYQVWVPVGPHRFSTDDERRQAERGIARWLRTLTPPAGLRVDYSSSDLPHLARMPGTVNTKTGRTSSLMKLTTGASDRTGGVGMSVDFCSSLLELGSVEPTKMSSSYIASEALDDPWKVLPHLTDLAQQVFLEGVESGDRHRALFALGASMARIEGLGDVLLDWLERANGRCRPPLDTAEVERIVRSVCGR